MEQVMAEELLTRPARRPTRRGPVRTPAGPVRCCAMFSWYPMVREFIMSCQGTQRDKVTRQTSTIWVGLKNYTRIWHDPTFAEAWKNTVEFSLLALLIGFAVPFVVAIVL